MDNIVLTPSQEELYNKITNAWDNKINSKILVTGSAGSGKSTSVFKAIEDIYNKDRPRITFLAPTHNALAVVRRIGDQWKELGNIIEFNTVASALHMRPRRIGAKMKFVPSREPEWHSDIYLIDEVSQIPQETLDYILSASDETKMVIFLGDKCQLPPVTEGSDKSEENESPVFSMPEITDAANLTEIVRYSGDVLRVADAIRKDMEVGYVNLLKLIPEDSETIHTIHLSAIKDEYAKAMLNGEYCKVLAFRNSTVDAVNEKVHEYLGNTDFFSIGNKIVNLSPIVKNNSIIPIETALTIKEITENSINLGVYSKEFEGLVIDYTKLGVTYYEDKCSIEFFGLNQEQKQKYDDVCKEIIKICKKDPTQWKNYYSIIDNYIPCRLPYSTTIHKSQGDTYDKVILVLPDLSSCRDFLLYNKLLYTAFTRTRGKVLVATA